jgi:ribosomal protein L11 methyltransferase
MSFGTGHHATTSMMLQMMRKIDFNDKSVLDFGTGTGVLAILAAKSGASDITAIDNDEWSIRNAEENFRENKTTGIRLHLSETLLGHNEFDVVLANINLNVLCATVNDVKSVIKWILQRRCR